LKTNIKKKTQKMSSVATATANEITLRGSTQIVTEFFGYSINSILYQRGIYPPETFSRAQKYGLTMMVTSSPALQDYLNKILGQLSEWLIGGQVQKIVLAISSVETKETLERWTFNVETDQDTLSTGKTKEKSEKVIMGEIQAIIRQITASVSFLPLLQENCTFDMLIYTNNDAQIPNTWEETDAKFIANQQDVRLRSFTTKVHKVDAMVSYKGDDGDDDI
jgi:mitotic spindle assembly checkpoint protein MAD2